MPYTPAPWIPVKGTEDDDWGVTQEGVAGMSVAQMVWADDAPLIAAAPELLEACIDALRSLEAFEPRENRTVDILRAAIAKAEGKTT